MSIVILDPLKNRKHTELKGMQEKGYGVTRWADPQSIRDSLKELTDTNIYAIPKDVYENDIQTLPVLLPQRGNESTKAADR